MFARYLLLFAAFSILNIASADPGASRASKEARDLSAKDLDVQMKYKAEPVELNLLRGVYVLSDGRRLRIWDSHRRLFAELGDRTIEMMPVSKDTYVAKDGSAKLRFSEESVETTLSLSEQ